MQLEGHRSQTIADSPSPKTLVLSGSHLDLDVFDRAVQGQVDLKLSNASSVVERVQQANQLVQQAVKNREAVYGVTTGFGGMANEAVPGELADQLQCNLLNFLSAGVGEPIDARHVRGAMLARANMLLRGHSGIRLELIERMISFLNANAVPLVREHGSIGASGDLVPLAAIARAITGQGHKVKVEIEGESLDSAEALSRLGYSTVDLQAKEGLALVNGSSFSAAIAANSLIESRKQFCLAMGIQAIFLRTLLAHEQPFESFVHECKPHPGQLWVARTIHRMLTVGADTIEDKNHPVQDRYSIRCLPQYFGPIAEGLGRLQKMVETEINGVSDNPLVDPEAGCLVQSGNFLGQAIGMGMDELRRHIALTAKHLDIQIAMIVAPEFNGGLNASLKGNIDNPVNMGLKGLQIAGNSIAPMLMQKSSPLVEHFPTYAEQFNQNINGLSWGSANLAWESTQLFSDYLSISLLFAVQAADLRSHQVFGHYDGRKLLGTLLEPLYQKVFEIIGESPSAKLPLLFNDTDRCLEKDIEKLSHAIRGSEFAEFLHPVLQSFESELGNG